jgi:uncharacterized YigZ family protein
MEKDSFLTIENSSEGLFKDKGSRFLAFAYPVKDEKEIREKLEILHKKYHDARHHCFAWRLGSLMIHFRTFDDGEPPNSAGKPILGQILSFNLTNILIVVVRYFGGTLLGVGGLIRAYKTASNEALKNAKIVKKYLHDVYHLKFKYDEINDVMRIIKELQLEYFDQDFKQNCELKVKVRRSQTTLFKEQFRNNPDLKAELLFNE